MFLEKSSEDDVKKIAKLLRDSWNKRNLNCGVAASEEYVRKGHKIEIKKDQMFKIMNEKKIVGCVALVCDDNGVAQIRDFVTLEEANRIESGAVREILEWCKVNSIRKVFGFLDEKKSVLLRSLGFKEEGVLKDHFRKGEDLRIMSLLLEKEEKQVDLSRKIEEENIFKEASERLRKLPLNKQ